MLTLTSVFGFILFLTIRIIFFVQPTLEGEMLKKALVIGASHFCGSHLVKRLVRLGFRVTALVDTNDSLWRLVDCMDSLELKRANFFSPKDMKKIVNHYSSGLIFYVSNYGQKHHQVNRELTYYLNFTLVKEIVDNLLDGDFESFVYIGSYLERVAELDLKSCEQNDSSTENYWIAKHCATTYLSGVAEKTGLPIYSARPSQVYGQYFSSKTAFGKFILNASLRKRLLPDTLFLNKGYVHVRDFVNYVVSVAMLKPEGRVVFDCGSGETLSLKSVVEIIKTVIPEIDDSGVDYEMFEHFEKNSKPFIAGDPPKDILPAWVSRMSLEDGVRDLLLWSRSNTILYRDFFQEEDDKKNRYYFPWMT